MIKHCLIASHPLYNGYNNYGKVDKHQIYIDRMFLLDKNPFATTEDIVSRIKKLDTDGAVVINTKYAVGEMYHNVRVANPLFEFKTGFRKCDFAFTRLHSQKSMKRIKFAKCKYLDLITCMEAAGWDLAPYSLSAKDDDDILIYDETITNMILQSRNIHLDIEFGFVMHINIESSRMEEILKINPDVKFISSLHDICDGFMSVNNKKKSKFKSLLNELTRNKMSLDGAAMQVLCKSSEYNIDKEFALAMYYFATAQQNEVRFPLFNISTPAGSLLLMLSYVMLDNKMNSTRRIPGNFGAPFLHGDDLTREICVVHSDAVLKEITRDILREGNPNTGNLIINIRLYKILDLILKDKTLRF